MFELKINGETYTEEQYKKDLIRMFDSIRNEYKGFANCDGVYCGNCPINTNIGDCNKLHRFEVIETVYNWAKKHPVVTNRDKMAKAHPAMTNREKLKEVFNVNLDKDAELYLSYYAGQRVKFDLTVEDRWINQPINKWLDAEYKEPAKEE